jgi:hypothetical protein
VVVPAFGFDAFPWFARQLHPAHDHWSLDPGQLHGFWHSADPGAVQARTGANAFSRHLALQIESAATAGGPRIRDPYGPVRPYLEFGFTTESPLARVEILASSGVAGSRARFSLHRERPDGVRELLAVATQQDARVDPVVSLQMGGRRGAFVVRVTAASRRIDVWPGASAALSGWMLDPVAEGGAGRLTETLPLGWVVDMNGERVCLRHSDSTEGFLAVGRHDAGTVAQETGMEFAVGVGEHNNPFFVAYPDAFVAAHPESVRRDRGGNLISVTGVNGRENPVPAVDCPVLHGLSSQLVEAATARFAGTPALRYWVIGGEEAYPDYFGLPEGDHRPRSRHHFRAYCALRGWSVNEAPERPGSSPTETAAWALFREQAMVDRATAHMQVLLAHDPSRPVFHPTHGNPFLPYGRRTLGHSPGGFASACDGFETGQITLDQDSQDLNRLTLAHLVAYGCPVVTPRLANKTLAADALGGGRSFTSDMLRRLVFECLGYGVGHIGLVQWEGDLPDGEWQIAGTPAEAEAKAVFRALTHLRPWLAGMSRLQPRFGLYVSDATWLHAGWQPRWSGLLDDIWRQRLHVDIVGDVLLEPGMVDRVPVLVSADNGMVSALAVRGLLEYLDAGGRLLVWGAFAERDELGAECPDVRRTILAHSRTVLLRTEPEPVSRMVENATSTASGVHRLRQEFRPVPFAAVHEVLSTILAPGELCPIMLDVVDGAPMDSLILTDGSQLLLLVINPGGEARDYSLGLRQPWDDWAWEATRVLVCDRDGLDLLPVSAWGGVIGPAAVHVWHLVPEGLASGEKALVERTAALLERWRAAGVRTEALSRRFEAVAEASPGRRAGFCVSVLRRVGVRVSETRGGGLRVVLVPGRVDGAFEVRGRCVPGSGRWRRFRQAGEFLFELESTRLVEDAVAYDMEAETYTDLGGPVRLLVEVRDSRGRVCGGDLHALSRAAGRGSVP